MSREFIFDPRKLIVGPWHPCPRCGAQALGTLGISGYSITRRCRECLYTAPAERLPPIQKNVVYLDQFVLSNIAKSLDPVWRAERGAPGEYWVRLFDALDRALKLQLIVCPESRIHEEESVVHPHFRILRRLYWHFGNGTSFEFPTLVHGIQLGHALQAKLEGRPVDYSSIPRSRIIHGDVDEWTDHVQIHVDWPAAYPDPALLNRVRENSGQAFERIFFDRWAKEKKPFEEVYREERMGYAQTTLELVRRHAEVMKAVAEGGLSPLSEEVWNRRLEVDTFFGLVAICEQAGLDQLKAVDYVFRFLVSEEALSAPYNEISSLLMAGLARRAAAGQKRPPSRGMWNDITVISAFFPYCDAMFIDRECASLLREEPIRSRIGLPTRVFSVTSGEGFLEYLVTLESEAGAEHLELVVRTYGEEWLAPFRTVLEHERERETRGKAEREETGIGREADRDRGQSETR